MNVLHLSQWLSVTIFVLCPGDVTGQFTAAPPTCPDDTFTFTCTVTGNMSGETTWRVGGNSECALQHRSLSTTTCGPDNALRARSGTGFGTSATSFTSTLSGTATTTLNDALVECYNGTAMDPRNRVGGDTLLQILGPPFVPTLSCVDLSEDVSGAVNVTVNWTLSGGDSADFYLINITTNAPQTPYGGLLNITTGSVTQYKLTGFMASYEYNITVRGVNCESQEGRESEPLTITPQVPTTPTHLNMCATYDMVKLLNVESSWNEVDPVTVAEHCANGRDIKASYVLSYDTTSGIHITTCIVEGTVCSNGICNHELRNNTADSRCQPPVSQFSGEGVTVSVAAKNTVGRSNSSVSRNINRTDFRLNVNSTLVECTFFQRRYNCTIDYGTDPSYTNLVYRDTYSTRGPMATIMLSRRLRRNTIYYYIVSIMDSSQCVKVRGRFKTECIMTDLGITTRDEIVDPRCTARGFLSVSSISGGVVCYNGTTAGSRALYICNNDTLRNERTRNCLRDGTWSGSTPMCITANDGLDIWHYTLMAIGGIALLAAIGLDIHEFSHVLKPRCQSNHLCFARKGKDVNRPNGPAENDKVKLHHHIVLLVFVAICFVIGVAFYIAVGVVVSNPPNDFARDGVIISTFVISIMVFIFALAVYLVCVCHDDSRCGRKSDGQSTMTAESERVELPEVETKEEVKVSDGLTSASASESNVQDNSLVHNQKLAQPRDLGIPLTNRTTSFQQHLHDTVDTPPSNSCESTDVGGLQSHQSVESSEPQQSDSKGSASLPCPPKTNKVDGAPPPHSHTSTEHIPGTNAEVAREEEMRHGVCQINTEVKSAGPKHSVLFMAARGGDLGTVKSFDEGADVIAIKDNQEMTLLHVAAEGGKLNIVEYLVGKWANVNTKNQFGRTPLHVAAENGHLEIVKHLFVHGADISAKDVDGRTPLHMAAKGGYNDTVEYLVKEGAHINRKDRLKRTSLHMAAEGGHIDTVQYLVGKRASIDIKDVDQRTPQYAAAEGGHMKIVEYLADNKAGINITDETGWTPMHVAAEIGNLHVVECLVDKGANVNSKDRFGWTPLHVAAEAGHENIVKYLVMKQVDVNIKDEHGPTSLHIAARQGYVNIVNLLVGNGAKMNSKDDDGKTPLHVAAEGGHTDTVKCLVYRKADMNVKHTCSGRTPLHMAVEEDKKDIVDFLVKEGADTNIKDDAGRTPMHIAARKGCVDILKGLHVADSKADINCQDDNGWTPLHVAAERGCMNVLEYLVNEGADIHIKDRNGRIALHVAVEGGYVDTVRFLVDQGADDINSKDKNGMTPLHVAVERGRFKIVDQRYLIGKGADINIKDNSGRTPLHIAVRESYLHTVKSLVGSGANINLQDNKGMTPLHVAAEKGGRFNILEYLADSEADINIQDNDGRTPLHIAAGEDRDVTLNCLVVKGANINIKDKVGRTPLDVAVEKGHDDIIDYLKVHMN